MYITQLLGILQFYTPVPNMFHVYYIHMIQHTYIQHTLIITWAKNYLPNFDKSLVNMAKIWSATLWIGFDQHVRSRSSIVEIIQKFVQCWLTNIWLRWLTKLQVGHRLWVIYSMWSAIPNPFPLHNPPLHIQH